ncbi:hypothetical protein, partial [Rubrivirga sp.]|uniref:hypothetical protein n=1 Tax=Rubrivirga sp. TaxID=1885344 RepID=UPI003C73991D
AYTTIVVIAHEFVGVWKVNKIPESAAFLANTADPNEAPNKVGRQNKRKSQQGLQQEILQTALYRLMPSDLKGELFAGKKSLIYESHEILKILRNLDSNRIQINPRGFIRSVELMRKFFPTPIDAIHAFYTIVAYWDITCTVAENEYENGVRVVGFKGNKSSELVEIAPNLRADFKHFVETHYVFTNEGSGLTADYYFSRFDEVLSEINPEYAKQHGIFFTDENLSKFALWFVGEQFHPDISERYIVFDPAGGSGNLVSSWRGNLKHKVVSELQPDLLRTIERRMKIDPYHTQKGFTIIPKTSENRGLNFLNRSAEDYLGEVQKTLEEKHLQFDKPLAFLLNPPYKNTDENQQIREKAEAHYDIHESIIELTGEDAGKERYLAFLGQIIRMAEVQVRNDSELQPIVMIFTPTSWLIPRPTYVSFRQQWDQHFSYQDGFITTSNEFFKLKGKWPLAFTIWQYQYQEAGNDNAIKVYDLTHLTRNDLATAINPQEKNTDNILRKALAKTKKIRFDNSRSDIRESLPPIERNKKMVRQPRYDFSHAKKKEDYGKVVSGFPIEDERNHFELRRKCGSSDSEFVGFMDNLTPVRVLQDTCNRLTNEPNRFWFYLDNRVIKLNLSKIFCGPADNRSYCAYDLESARVTCSWYATTKAINGRYPVWMNQYNVWKPEIKPELEDYFYSLCFAYVLAENRCVVTKFEADNPVPGAPEVYVDNPLCPTNDEAFWSTTLDSEVVTEPPLAHELVEAIKKLYQVWALDYCQGQVLENVGLHDEPYFRYFSYPDFLTSHSGLIQIRKYAEIHADADL